MEKTREYETMFVAKPDLEDEEQEALQEKFKGVITENGGEITDIDIWGSRNLAYEIKDYKTGFYTVMNFTSSPDFVQELDRRFKIDDNILRHLIVRVEE